MALEPVRCGSDHVNAAKIEVSAADLGCCVKLRESTEVPDSERSSTSDASVMRPYVWSTKHKLTWTRELHEHFMAAVNRRGGETRATPKKILELINCDGVTINHIKSHLQMLRLGKISVFGMPEADADDHDHLVQFKPISSKRQDLSLPPGDIAHRVGDHNQLSPINKAPKVYRGVDPVLKHGYRIRRTTGAESNRLLRWRSLTDLYCLTTRGGEGSQSNLDIQSGIKSTHESFPINGDSSPASAGVLDQRIKRGKHEDIDLDLTMSSYISLEVPRRAKLQFSIPWTPEEASITLGLCL